MADNKKHKKRKRLLIAGAVIILAVLLYDLSPFGGAVVFYAKWVECGQKPVVLYAKPGFKWYADARSFKMTIPMLPGYEFGYSTYKCTALEAEQAGYSASATTWTFPHLHKN